MATAGEDGAPDTCFLHPHAPHFVSNFYFHAYGNTPPSDLLQHVPHDAARADILSLGCGDLRDLLYSIVLHGRRGVSCGPVPRPLTFTLNDWEPAVHARNLMMLTLILDSRNLLEAASADTGATHGRMEAMGVCGSEASSTPVEVKSGEAVRQTKRPADSKPCNTKAGSHARPVSSEGLGGRQEHNAAFAQRIGLIFSAMYNVFVDADVLHTIQDVAGRLTTCIASSAKWKSTELGRLVHFTDDRSQDRVRDILALYADVSLQTRCPAASVKKQRSTFIAKRVPNRTAVLSRTMGLASLRQDDNDIQAHNETVKTYLAEGILDPFPLLLAEQKVSAKRTPSKSANPLLLVTETKGIAYSLHYAAMPLDAFHTEGLVYGHNDVRKICPCLSQAAVASWKLREASMQDEHGKLAPTVLRKKTLDTRSRNKGSPTASARKGVQDARFGAALEQLAQMCGGFLAATRIIFSEPDASMASATLHLRININVGDAVNFCDAMLAASTTSTASQAAGPESGCGVGAGSSGSPAFKGISFQQGTLQPLRLRKGVLMEPRAEFDVISTSNLAEHIGVVNVLVATAPLLGPLPHSVLLTSFMSSVRTLNLHKDTKAFCDMLLCMDSQAAALLLGVVPMSNLSSVVGHTDTLSFIRSTGSESSSAIRAECASPLRLTWKHPAQPSTATDSPSGSTGILGDISPSDFVDLTLPVYKAMFAHMPTTAMLSPEQREQAMDERAKNMWMPKYYTSVSFGRLLVLAGLRLRLKTAHFQAALRAIINESELVLAPNLMQEQDALFYALGISPISQVSLNTPLDTRRVVLLVPASGLSLLREFNAPEMFLALSGIQEARFENHFANIHMAFVRVRRGGSKVEGGTHDWKSLSQHLEVQDTREDDPEAELMVSTIVPTYALTMAPLSLTELRLRPRDSFEMFQASAHVMRRLGGLTVKAFYGAGLTNKDRTAILGTGELSLPWSGGSSSPALACPKRVVSSRCEGDTGSGSPELPPPQCFVNGKSHLMQTLEVISQPGRGRDAPFMARVVIVMDNDEARQRLAIGGIPRVEATGDPCSVRVILGEGLVHMARFPFSVTCKDVKVVYGKSRGFACFTVLPLEGLLEVPFALTASNVEDSGHRRLLSTFCWPMCVPLASLPRLDFNTEWAHHKVMGTMSAHNADCSSDRASGGPHPGFRGFKASFLKIVSVACATHEEDNPTWKHEWACIMNDQRHDGPALWVWVNEILLDPSNQALVLDCCILPVDSMDHKASLQLGAVVGGMATEFIQVCQEEFDLWTALLPVAVERARQTYAHAKDCIYMTPSGACPTVCSCGMSKDLPPTFMESMKSVKAISGGAALTTLVYRVALSPLYAPAERTAAKGSATGSEESSGVRCTTCRKGGALMRCSRCRKVNYCSKECQRQDWKNHKPKCAAESGSDKP